LLIIAPRHLENTERIQGRADTRGITWQCRSGLSTGRPRRAPLLILDTIGELRHVYAVASVVFCGASLVPLGGQDILEPAVWAKPVLYGPFMDDFDAARRLLESVGGGICVGDANELADRAAYLLTHTDAAQAAGQRAFEAIKACQGAAQRHAAVIRMHLSRTGH
jgi:3-deoxy-D-manno-octulosonic-acid transferase